MGPQCMKLTVALNLLVLMFMLYQGGSVMHVLSTDTDMRRRYRKTVTGLRLRHFVKVVPTLFLVFIAVGLLWQIKPLHFGWWSLLGGQGNPALGKAQGLPTWGVWLGMLVAACTILGMRLLAYIEEQLFRVGAEHRSLIGNGIASLLFGLMHILIGIPLAVALALTIGGFAFTH